MEAAMVGSSPRTKLRSAIIWGLLLVATVSGLSVYKRNLTRKLARGAQQTLQVRHPRVLGLFQASFYFFYDDQFVPGIQNNLGPVTDGPPVERIVITSTGTAAEAAAESVVFDSRSLQTARTGAKPEQAAKQGSELLDFLAQVRSARGQSGAADQPLVLLDGFNLRIYVPSGATGILYFFDGARTKVRFGLAVLFAVLSLAGLRWFMAGQHFERALNQLNGVLRRYWRLRAKFLVTIVLINLIAAGIVFVTLVSLQTREQTERIEKESVLFSQFSTAPIISDFTNFYYFYYSDRFLPQMKQIIASDENLLAIQIISRKTNRILFDSEQTDFGSTQLTPAQLQEGPKTQFSPEIEEQLKTRDLVTERSDRDGRGVLRVISTYKNENQEPVFWVEYTFAYKTLRKSIDSIRQQLLIDLIPSLGIGLLLAIVFAQLLISPIRRLVQALHRVTSGDYDVSVALKSEDEIGELVGAFNTMTAELKKKKELRKYLSDSTYRQIMEAPDSPEGVKLGGAKLSATVLFSDIRNFVAHCESLPAEEVTSMLNEYFSEMVEVVYKHGGEVDKFIGDALLAVFYAQDDAKTIRPVDQTPWAGAQGSGATTALQAIYCAMEMRERLAEFNQRRKLANKSVIEIGVGISHGEIISGPIGSKDRMDFTVIGDVVNLANRIEKLSKLGHHTKIVFSNHIEDKIRGLLDYEEIKGEKIRGKEEEVHVYELIGIRDLQVLVENLRGSDQELKRRSIELLGQSRNVSALPHVIACLKDPDEDLSLTAIVAVGKLAPRDHVPALDALFEFVRLNPRARGLSTAIATIGKICASERILELAPFLDSADERIVANAVEALGQVRNATATDLILPKLNSRNNRVKANAAMAVFAAGHIEVVDSLKPMLMHSDPLMRSSAAFALGELTLIAAQAQLVERWKHEPKAVQIFLGELQECVPMLVSLLKDPEPMVKRQAVIALGKIKDKSAVLPIIEMIDPKMDSKDLIRDISQALRSIGSHSLVREVIARLSSGTGTSASGSSGKAES